MFTPEVLLVIAYVGCITLFIAATIAITATDIKRVLAYSTVSQLGYMMLALGVGGWVAGLFHLVTHAFFKCLLFLCSGSVIHACHTNEMPEMGGLRKKMPWTACTMLVGCLAIIGAGIPFVIGLSRLLLQGLDPRPGVFVRAGQSRRTRIFFWAVAGGAAITAFYMFRLWFMTFAGQPRDHHVAEHAHESPQRDVRAAGGAGRLRGGGRLDAARRARGRQSARAGPAGRHGRGHDRRLRLRPELVLSRRSTRAMRGRST